MKQKMLCAVTLLIAGTIVMATAACPRRQSATKPGEYIIAYDPPYIGLAAKVGTLGPGLEASIGIVEWLNLRAGGYYFRVRHGGSVRDVEYDFDIKLASVPLLADWHPFENEFRITGGVIYNRNMADLDGTPNKKHENWRQRLHARANRRAERVVRFNWAPYIGLGYGNAVLDADKTWGFVFDIGIMWQGSPSVALAANGTKAGDPTFQQDLAMEESDIQGDAVRCGSIPCSPSASRTSFNADQIRPFGNCCASPSGEVDPDREAHRDQVRNSNDAPSP